jgi:hypothetical protein
MDQTEDDPLESRLSLSLSSMRWQAAAMYPGCLQRVYDDCEGIGGVYGSKNAGMGADADGEARKAVNCTVYVLTTVATQWSSMQVSRGSAFLSRFGNANYLCSWVVRSKKYECIHYVIFTGHMFEDLQTRAQKIPAPPSYKVDIIRFLHAIRNQVRHPPP